jgi:hypothetical protein
MVSMEMADENPRHARRGDTCKNKLPLRSFSRIKKESFFIPA